MLFTDGLAEARDRAGRFFPLGESAGILAGGTLEHALDALLTRLADFAGHRVNDDMALVVAEHRDIPRA